MCARARRRSPSAFDDISGRVLTLDSGSRRVRRGAWRGPDDGLPVSAPFPAVDIPGKVLLPKMGTNGRMSGSTDPAVRLFGSEVRAKVLGVLAQSREPKTGYRVSKILDTYPSKVYEALRDLEDTPFVEVVGGARGKRYLLADEDLRKLLLRAVRVAGEDDWFADRARRIEEGRRVLERLPAMEVPRVTGEPGPRARAVLREFARPRGKDRILSKMGLRTARRRPKRLARD